MNLENRSRLLANYAQDVLYTVFHLTRNGTGGRTREDQFALGRRRLLGETNRSGTAA